MTQMTAELWVKFAVNEKPDPNFNPKLPYPVFAIDIWEEEDGSETTRFLLSDHQGVFRWLPARVLRRLPAKDKPSLAEHRKQMAENLTRNGGMNRAPSIPRPDVKPVATGTPTIAL